MIVGIFLVVTTTAERCDPRLPQNEGASKEASSSYVSTNIS